MKVIVIVATLAVALAGGAFASVMDSTVRADAMLTSAHIDLLKVRAEGIPRTENLLMCADIVSFIHVNKNLLAPRPSDAINYCEKIFREYVDE